MPVSIDMLEPSNNNDCGVNVMVVDDSTMIRVMAEQYLVQAGYKVTLAHDGFEALSKIVEHPPEVIIMDILMPEIDGYQTCALIKNHNVFKDIPIIMLSSKDGAQDQARGAMAGFDMCLSKPFSADSLYEAVSNVVATT